jgi:hypothetical protein
MATTDLSSKSLGDILLQSGIGTPDHSAPLGSLYTDKSTGSLWRNVNGSTSWEKLATVAYAEVFYQTNTTLTDIVTQNVWTPVTNSFTLGEAVGFTASGSTLVLGTGYTGTYEVRGDITLAYQAGSANYEAGLSVNSADPVAGAYGGNYVDVTYNRQHIGFQTIVSLTGGTTLSIEVRNLDSTADVTVRHAQLTARRV